MKNTLLFAILLTGAFLQGQVSLDSLSLHNRGRSGVFYNTTECERDSLFLHGLDTGATAGFEYRWTYYRADASGNKVQPLLAGAYAAGAINEYMINEGLETIKKLDEPLVLLQLDIRNNTSSDSAQLPLMIKSLPQVKQSYIQTFGALVFTQPDKLGFDSVFPGPWVAPVAVGPYIDFAHHYFDRYRFRLEEYDQAGNKLRNVPLHSTLNDTLQVNRPFTALNGFNLSLWLRDTADFFMNNTTREYYRFSFYYGVEGCGWDSATTYFSLITPQEIGMAETEAFELKIYPNPASDKVVVETEEEFTSAVLYDQLGRVVLVNSGPPATGKIELMVDDLPAGIYLLRLAVNGKILHRKIEVH